MKKYISVIWTTLLFVCFTACGSKTVEEGLKQEGQQVYCDIEVTKQQLWELSYDSIGVQFYQGEPVQILCRRHIDIEESPTEKVKSYDICLQRSDDSLEILYEKVPIRYPKGILDEEGGLYFYNVEKIVKLDSDGKIAYEVSFQEKAGGSILDICYLSDTRFLIMLRNKTFWIMDAETGEITEIDMGFKINDAMYLAAWEGAPYLLERSGVWAINEEDGSKKPVLLFEGTSYDVHIEDIGNKQFDFWITEEGTLELLREEDDIFILETLTLKSIENKTVITLRTTKLTGKFKDWVAEFNRTNETYSIVIDECREGTDVNDFVTQTGVQLATGKGADLYLGIEMRNTMWSLMEKGAFEDLKQYVEASGIKEEDYFPFVFDILKKDDKIYGIYPFVSATRYYISEEVMGDYGSPENVETLADALLAYKEKAVLKKNYTSPQVLEWFLKGSENLWGMLDWENASCDFSGELFAKLLEVSKRYGYDEKNNYPELLCELRAYDFEQYILTENVQWDGNVPAGPFFDDGCYAGSGDYATVYVSATSEHKEGAWEFIKFCLSGEMQSDTKRPVQKEAFRTQAEEKITEDAGRNAKEFMYMHRGPMTMEKAEAMEQILDSTHCYPIRTAPVLDIVIEEAGAYFSGTKSIEEVVAIIENRVGLYLEENK